MWSVLCSWLIVGERVSMWVCLCGCVCVRLCVRVFEVCMTEYCRSGVYLSLFPCVWLCFHTYSMCVCVIMSVCSVWRMCVCLCMSVVALCISVFMWVVVCVFVYICSVSLSECCDSISVWVSGHGHWSLVKFLSWNISHELEILFTS